MNSVRKPPRDVHAFTDQSNDKGYFTITPRIVLAICRNPFDYTLWSVVKDVAGETRECYIGAKNLGKLAMMSAGQVQSSRAYLLSVRLLCGEKQFNESIGHDVWHLWIPDLWSANLKWCEEYRTIESRIAFKDLQRIKPSDPLQPNLIEQTFPFMDGEIQDNESTAPKYSVPYQSTEYHAIALSTIPNDASTAPKYSVPHGDVKEEQVLTEEEQEKQDVSISTEIKPNYARLWEIALASLELQMTRTTFNTYLSGTTVDGSSNGKLVIKITNWRRLDMINRMKPMIERTLSSEAGCEMHVEFVAHKKGRGMI